MFLKGTSISLRALEPEDLNVLYRWENDTSCWLVSGTLVPFSKHVLTEYISNAHVDIFTSKQLRLVIEKEGKTPVGCVDLFDFDPKNKRAGVGILIGETSERQKGYASEALDLLIQYAFSILDLHQLYCHISEDNSTSLQLFTGKGFQETGKKLDWIYDNGKWVNVCIFQLLKGL